MITHDFGANIHPVPVFSYLLLNFSYLLLWLLSIILLSLTAFPRGRSYCYLCFADKGIKAQAR